MRGSSKTRDKSAKSKKSKTKDAISRGGRRVDLLKIVRDAAQSAKSLEQVLLYTLDDDLDVWPDNFRYGRRIFKEI